MIITINCQEDGLNMALSYLNDNFLAGKYVSTNLGNRLSHQHLHQAKYVDGNDD